MILLLPLLAAASPTFDRPPVVGEAVEVRAVDDVGRPILGGPVRVITRVGLPGEREVSIGLTDARGTASWTPTEPGPTRVRVRDQVTTVRVTGGPAPLVPMILLIALVLLAGGLVIAGALRARSSAS